MAANPERRILRDAQRLVGLQIAGVRYTTDQERREFYVDHRGPVLVLSDGTALYVMADDEGNDAGALVARDKDGQETIFPVLDGACVRRGGT
jgi:hypothetical protein